MFTHLTQIRFRNMKTLLLTYIFEVLHSRIIQNAIISDLEIKNKL